MGPILDTAWARSIPKQFGPPLSFEFISAFFPPLSKQDCRNILRAGMQALKVHFLAG